MQKDDALNAAMGKRIKEIRTKRNLSQDTLAEMIEVCNGAHLSNIERGLYGVSVPKLVLLCKALDVSADYLLFGVSANDLETEIHNSLNKLNPKQRKYLMEIVKAYIKSCGIEE